MTHASFDQPDPLYQRCGNLLATLRHLELKEKWAFDQIEGKQLLATVWRAAAGAPKPMLELVRDDWVSPLRWLEKTPCAPRQHGPRTTP